MCDQGQGADLDLGRRLPRRAEPERGEPARRRRHGAARLGRQARRLAPAARQGGGEVNASTPIMEEAFAGTGAVIMGRNMFGPVRGPWTEPLWNGWWGDDPPFRVPVFVLTHHEREPLTLGETTFHFVTAGPERAVALAREAAGGKDVSVGGGGETIQQLIRAGLLEELLVNQVPVILGGGTRLLEGILPSVKLEQTRVVEAPGV